MDTPLLTDRVRAALQSVADPEIGESIVDLGLVERIEALPDQRLSVVLVPTSATCPMADLLVDDATEATEQALPRGQTVEVTLDFGLAWALAAAALVGLYGLAGHTRAWSLHLRVELAAVLDWAGGTLAWAGGTLAWTQHALAAATPRWAGWRSWSARSPASGAN